MNMLPSNDDGRLQVTAAVSLFERSGLVKWDRNSKKFVAVLTNEFDHHWQEVDPVFGRFICWINFSTGAELLAKGVCLLNGVEIRGPKCVPAYPSGDLQQWSEKFCKDWKAEGVVAVVNYGVLSDLNTKHLKELCGKELPHKAKAKPGQERLLTAAYELLARSIRNRDSHAYVPHVRGDHFELVPTLFADCFNLLVSWLPGGCGELNGWISSADEFVHSLRD